MWFLDTSVVYSFLKRRRVKSEDRERRYVVEHLLQDKRVLALSPITVGEIYALARERRDEIDLSALRHFKYGKIIWNRAKRNVFLKISAELFEHFSGPGKGWKDIGLRDLLSIVWASATPKARGIITSEQHLLRSPDLDAVIAKINNVRREEGMDAFSVRDARA